MSFMLGQDGWVEVGKAVVLAGADEGLSCSTFVVEGFADAVLRLVMWFD